MVNFCEVRRAQLAKSAFHTSALVPLGFFHKSFRYVGKQIKEGVGKIIHLNIETPKIDL